LLLLLHAFLCLLVDFYGVEAGFPPATHLCGLLLTTPADAHNFAAAAAARLSLCLLQMLVDFYGVEAGFPLATHLITRSLEAAFPKRLYYVSTAPAVRSSAASLLGLCWCSNIAELLSFTGSWYAADDVQGARHSFVSWVLLCAALHVAMLEAALAAACTAFTTAN
jgi:hypothetical protein